MKLTACLYLNYTLYIGPDCCKTGKYLDYKGFNQKGEQEQMKDVNGETDDLIM